MSVSIWEKTVDMAKRPPLCRDMKTDVAVIGGGMAGILTAYQLKKAGRETVVLEADRIGGGMTANTTAKITIQHGLIYDWLLKHFKEEEAKLYASVNRNAVNEYACLVKELSIDCDFEMQPAYIYTCGDAEPIEREAEAAGKLGIRAAVTTKTDLPFAVNKAVRFDRQYQFHPLLFLKRICEEVTIYEGTRVVGAGEKDCRLLAEAGGKAYTIQANQVVFATHYPFINNPGFFFWRMHQERSNVIAIRTTETLHTGMYLGVNKDELSYRRYQDLILLGGGNYRTGKNGGGSYEALERAARKYYPDKPEVCRWSNQDGMTIDRVPFIGLYSEKTPNWYVAGGFEKWGMSTSMAAALLIRDHICGKRKDFGIFSPQRFQMKASAAVLGEEFTATVKSFCLRLFYFPREAADKLSPGEGRIMRYQGKRAGVYKEEGGRVYAVDIVCPHLGCLLSWNPDEKTWDCPCHGSRFDYKGNLISNPANRDAAAR